MQTLAQLKAGQLNGIKRLQLVEELTQFPQEIFDLADSLEILDLSNNKLSSLPEDLCRLHRLKILFISNNEFEHLPNALGKCPQLEMIGFKANKIKTIADDALPVQTRWLILTDNKIEKLPSNIGKLHRLQKLALAGNQLSKLPDTMANCKSLELIRLSANKLTALPNWLIQLPKLSWFACSGNDFNANTSNNSPVEQVKLIDFELTQQIGEGASGFIHKAKWINQPNSLKGTAVNIAVKLFKGEVTSDGYPQDELNCCLTAGEHTNLIKVIGQIAQTDQLGLVMELIPSTYGNLGLPPSLKTRTRDTFEANTTFSIAEILKITIQMSNTLNHLHKNNVSHGDIYAHNTMINSDSDMLFGDFGAATDLSGLTLIQQEAIESIEVRAFGCLLDDLLSLNNDNSPIANKLNEIKDNCMQTALPLRPRFEEINTLLMQLSNKTLTA
ncbi:leucine-rich repeat-containing serine/threonine-protein kinase [Pseudoalteromonas sp. C2R02]|uniref:leucine-rich repeat-containing protein kinase family protein n=1 Tax=Pseudoalteromonas sp. C2R02 TaxID=2841565 RepID=UPI001C09DC04|nr:leucine-rich repeat-containing protein kinase family protein [Pseudoalteromonas sp. C2R02]MBU2971676.1 leucine-rich repeat-containing serine/threonine-protein kinase [Pseudoalteromonas sp. C2R02]